MDAWHSVRRRNATSSRIICTVQRYKRVNFRLGVKTRVHCLSLLVYVLFRHHIPHVLNSIVVDNSYWHQLLEEINIRLSLQSVTSRRRQHSTLRRIPVVQSNTHHQGSRIKDQGQRSQLTSMGAFFAIAKVEGEPLSVIEVEYAKTLATLSAAAYIDTVP
jgi:hypothetical protein